MECCDQAVKTLFKNFKREYGYGEFDTAEDARSHSDELVLRVVDNLEDLWTITKIAKESKSSTNH